MRVIAPLPAHFTGSSAYEEVSKALAGGLSFDAVFAASDGIALSVIKAIEDAGRSCPEDVAVVGFDDSDIAAQSRPSLTTVRQDFPRIAATLVDHLFMRMKGQEAATSTLPVQLIVRESAPALPSG